MENKTVSANIIIAIKRQLKGLFPEYNIYTRQREQGIIEPCFLVRIRKASRDRQLSPQYWYTFTVEVVYLPLPGAAAEHLEDVKEELLFTFDEIPFMNDTHLRSMNDHAEIIEDTIVYTSDYKILVEKEVVPDEWMETLEEKQYTDKDVYNDVTEKETDPKMWKPQENRKETNFKMWTEEDERWNDAMEKLRQRQSDRENYGGGVVWIPR